MFNNEKMFKNEKMLIFFLILKNTEIKNCKNFNKFKTELFCRINNLKFQKCQKYCVKNYVKFS